MFSNLLIGDLTQQGWCGLVLRSSVIHVHVAQITGSRVASWENISLQNINLALSRCTVGITHRDVYSNIEQRFLSDFFQLCTGFARQEGQLSRVAPLHL